MYSSFFGDRSNNLLCTVDDENLLRLLNFILIARYLIAVSKGGTCQYLYRYSVYCLMQPAEKNKPQSDRHESGCV